MAVSPRPPIEAAYAALALNLRAPTALKARTLIVVGSPSPMVVMLTMAVAMISVIGSKINQRSLIGRAVIALISAGVIPRLGQSPTFF